MSECKLCEKEQAIVSITGMQIPVGEGCCPRLISKDVVWASETKLENLEEMLKI